MILQKLVKISIALMLTLSVSLAYGDEAKPQEKAAAEPDIGLISEAFGYYMVQNLGTSDFHLDIDRVIKGMKGALAGNPAPLNEEEYESAILGLQEKVFTDMAVKNLEEANKFLKENAKAQGVVELIPGKLQYKITQAGNGPKVELHCTPLIHYTGKYADGTVFGSSIESKEPIALPLDQTIPGFSQGLLGMQEGEKRTLFIHPDLGYGISGQLPPNKLLIFDIELVKACPETEDNKKSE